MPKRYYTVVLDAFDGQQYGMLRIPVEAESEEMAVTKATKQAEDDGYTKIKKMMVL